MQLQINQRYEMMIYTNMEQWWGNLYNDHMHADEMENY